MDVRRYTRDAAWKPSKQLPEKRFVCIWMSVSNKGLNFSLVLVIFTRKSTQTELSRCMMQNDIWTFFLFNRKKIIRLTYMSDHIVFNKVVEL